MINKLYSHEFYKKMLEDVKKAKKEYQKLKESGIYSGAHLMENKNKLKSAFRNDLTKFYKFRSEEIEKELKAIEEKYKENYENVDPQKELLKRQDWERQYKLAGDDQLRDIVKEFVATGEGEKVQIELLQLELRSRGFEDEGVKVEAYKNHYGINEPHTRDENYADLHGELMLIEQMKNRDFAYEVDGDSRQIFRLDEM